VTTCCAALQCSQCVTDKQTRCLHDSTFVCKSAAQNTLSHPTPSSPPPPPLPNYATLPVHLMDFFSQAKNGKDEWRERRCKNSEVCFPPLHQPSPPPGPPCSCFISIIQFSASSPWIVLCNSSQLLLLSPAICLPSLTAQQSCCSNNFCSGTLLLSLHNNHAAVTTYVLVRCYQRIGWTYRLWLHSRGKYGCSSELRNVRYDLQQCHKINPKPEMQFTTARGVKTFSFSYH
jgi:hypothetical protein